MCDKVGDDSFLLRKKIENKLENAFPKKFRSRYAMTTYTLIPYHKVIEAGKVQAKVLDVLCSKISNIDELDLEQAEELIDQHFVPWLKSEKIELTRYIP